MLVKARNLVDDREITFMDVQPEIAVCYAFAEETDKLSVFLDAIHDGNSEEEKIRELRKCFPVTYGRYSVSVANWAVRRQEVPVKSIESIVDAFDRLPPEEIKGRLKSLMPVS